MLKNNDGTPYQVSGNISLYNTPDSEHCLFDLYDQEAIKIGGSPIEYYEVFIQTSTVDPLYLEDRGKIWSNNPIPLYATYEPAPSKNFMNAFGMDSPEEVIFELNYRAVLDAIGHPPKIGSRIFTPHLRENWEIIQRNTGEYKLWGVLRLQLLCKKFQESASSSPKGDQEHHLPEFRII